MQCIFPLFSFLVLISPYSRHPSSVPPTLPDLFLKQNGRVKGRIENKIENDVPHEADGGDRENEKVAAFDRSIKRETESKARCKAIEMP